MTQHNDLYCIQESRIQKLEDSDKNKRNDIQELKEDLRLMNENIGKLVNLQTEQKAIMNTLKYIIPVIVAVFGGAFLFLFQELVKIIH